MTNKKDDDERGSQGAGETLSGWLQKYEGKTLGKSRFRKCWFVLSHDTEGTWTISHYEHGTNMREFVGAERLAQGDRKVSQLKDIKSVSYLGQKKLKFEIKFHDEQESLVLRAVNDEVCERWVQALLDLLGKKQADTNKSNIPDYSSKSLKDKRRERESIRVANAFLQDSEIFMSKARTFTSQVKGNTLTRTGRTLERKKKNKQREDELDVTLPPPPPLPKDAVIQEEDNSKNPDDGDEISKKNQGKLHKLLHCKKDKNLKKNKTAATLPDKPKKKPSTSRLSFKFFSGASTGERKANTIHGDETLKRKHRNLSLVALQPKAKSGHSAKGKKEEKGPRRAVLPMMNRDLSAIVTDVKSEATSKLIKETIETSISLSGMLFEDLDRSALNSLVEKMYRVEVREGDDVVTQNDQLADKFYVIEKGRFHVYMQRGEDALPELVAEKGPRTFFGELALLYEQPSRVTVRAATEGVLWAINRVMFFEIRKAQARKRQGRKLRLLYGIDVISDNLQEADIIALAEAMDETIYRKGEVILEEGKPLEKVLIVGTGVVDIVTSGEAVGQLQYGETFGQWALLEKASKTDVKLVAGADETTTLTLDVEEFEGLVGSLRSLLHARWQENVGKLFPEGVTEDTNQTSAKKEARGKSLIKRFSKKRASTARSSAAENADQFVTDTLKTIKEQFTMRTSSKFRASSIASKASSMHSSDDGKSAVHLEWEECKLPCENVSLEDIECVARLGKGSFGRVHLVKNKCHGEIEYETKSGKKRPLPKYMALKVLSRHFIVRNGWEEMIENERHAMAEITNHSDSPFIVKLYAAFFDEKNIYFLLDVCDGGDMYAFVRRNLPEPRMKEKDARFYIASVILGLMSIHSRNVVYRDLKPENLLIDSDGFVKIADFGLAKKTLKTFTVCGTPDYMSREIILGSGHDAGADWWAVGVLIFELTTSVAPFPGREPMDIYESVLAHTEEKDLIFPDFAPLTKEAKSIVMKLLSPKSSRRLAFARSNLKRHPFFSGFNWQKLSTLQVQPPMKIKPRNVAEYECQDYVNDYDPKFDEHRDDRSGWIPNV